MKAMIPWFCLAAITQSVYAQTGIQAYRQGDFTRAATLLKSQATLNPTEEYYLGRLYLYGYGLLKSDGLAIQAFQQAANKGIIPAQLFMGRLELMHHNNPEQALGWFKKAAAGGEVAAQVYCAGAYLYGVGTKKNLDTARNYLIPAARANNSLAQVTLAASFLETHQSANRKLGLVWLEKAMGSQDPEAKVMMGELYLKGDLVGQDISQARKLAEEANMQKYAPSLYLMGRIEEHLLNAKEAESYYRQAIEAGYTPAELTLAKLYLDPKFDVYSVQKGFTAMLKAAESGSVEAQQALILMYQKGQGVEQNLELAAHWESEWQGAHDASSQEAEQRMVRWLTYGKSARFADTTYYVPGILGDWKNLNALQDNHYNPMPQMSSINPENLFKFQFAMMSPNEIPITQLYDAMVVAQGPLPKEVFVFPQYPIKMITNQAAEAGTQDFLQAKRNGFDYLLKQSTDALQGISYHQVYQQLLERASLGDSVAQFDVAQMYQQGMGTEKSISEAIKYYQLAAAQNDLPAEYQLGVLYLQGEEGLEPNLRVGMEWLTDAAFKGNYYAQYALARIYEQGFSDPSGHEVIAANPSQSKSMYQLAAASGYGLAQYRLAEIMVRETPKDTSVAGLQMRDRTIKNLYRGGASVGVLAAKLPLAFHDAMDPDLTKQAQAFSDAMEAAKSGSIDAALLLGLMYDRGIATQSSREQALYWYEKASNNPISAFILGTYAAEGTGFNKDRDKALDYLQFSVDKGFSEANYNLAVLKYQQGMPFIANLEKAIAAGSSRAGLVLADYNMTNHDGSQTLKQARDLYERYAQQGEKSAQVKLGYLYEQGLAVQQDYQQALRWYSVAAEQGYPEAQYLLGRLYQFGLVGSSPDYTVAKQWYALAQGSYPAAAIAYGFIDETVDDNYQHALNEYQQGADLNDPIASYNLGLVYEMGKHQEVNVPQAEEAYLRAANLGFSKAMVRLGVVYALEKKMHQAVSWLTKAAALGDSDAEYQLGLINEQGLGQSPEVAEAIQYYRQAATNGHAKAMLALARLYQEGVGVNKDLAQAAGYYKQLAQQDNPDAQYQLGLFCVYGALSDCTLQQGKIWLQKAQVNGHRDAGRVLQLYSAKSQEGVSYIESVSLQQGQQS